MPKVIMTSREWQTRIGIFSFWLWFDNPNVLDEAKHKSHKWKDNYYVMQKHVHQSSALENIAARALHSIFYVNKSLVHTKNQIVIWMYRKQVRMRTQCALSWASNNIFEICCFFLHQCELGNRRGHCIIIAFVQRKHVNGVTISLWTLTVRIYFVYSHFRTWTHSEYLLRNAKKSWKQIEYAADAV